jgi:hypothetical protein
LKENFVAPWAWNGRPKSKPAGTFIQIGCYMYRGTQFSCASFVEDPHEVQAKHRSKAGVGDAAQSSSHGLHHNAASRPNRWIWGSNGIGPKAERMVVGTCLHVHVRWAIGYCKMKGIREDRGIEKAFWILPTIETNRRGELPFAIEAYMYRWPENLAIVSFAGLLLWCGLYCTLLHMYLFEKHVVTHTCIFASKIHNNV